MFKDKQLLDTLGQTKAIGFGIWGFTATSGWREKIRLQCVEWQMKKWFQEGWLWRNKPLLIEEAVMKEDFALLLLLLLFYNEQVILCVFFIALWTFDYIFSKNVLAPNKKTAPTYWSLTMSPTMSQ